MCMDKSLVGVGPTLRDVCKQHDLKDNEKQ